MDFNYQTEWAAVNELRETLDGVKHCDWEIAAGFQVDYHQNLKEQYMRQYAELVKRLARRIGPNAAAVPMPEVVGVLLLDEAQTGEALLELDETEKAIAYNN